MNEDKSKIIIPKRATKTKLASSESVLKEGEIALIYPDTGPGTGAAKLVSGDGATVAKNLPIAIDGEAIDELRESLDIAKKIIPITLSLTDWKSANGDNSAPYVQTVINEELKSSMNPDLVSMLDESATPEEQEAYNKNLAIISQGVGTVNNGSITYKVYKLPSADITIGLTRLGGVKEVETASGVDDVKVGGVSVVKDKVAEIPEIPNEDTFVPYVGAVDNIDLGSFGITTNTDSVASVLTHFKPISLFTPELVGMLVSNKQDKLTESSGISYVEGDDALGTALSLVGFYRENDGSWRKETFRMILGTTSAGYSFIRFSTARNGIDLPFVLENIADPVTPLNAANKKYVDDKITDIASNVATKHFFKSVDISENSERLWRVSIKKTDGSDVPFTDLVSVTPIVQGVSSDPTKLRLTQNCVTESPDANFEKSIVGIYVIAYKNVGLTAQFTVGVQVVAPYKVTITEAIEKE